MKILSFNNLRFVEKIKGTEHSQSDQRLLFLARHRRGCKKKKKARITLEFRKYRSKF